MKRSECPFTDPEFEIPLSYPCPVCGALGWAVPLRDIEGNPVECIDDIEIEEKYITKTIG